MNPRQRAFAQAYAKTPSVYQAAREAGYSHSYANTIGPKQLLEQPEVVSEIKRIRLRMNEMADKSATDVVNQFSKIAFTDRVAFLKEDPERPGEYIYKSPDELTQVQRDCIENTKMYTAEIVVVEHDAKGKTETRSVFRQEYNYVFSDKAKALEQMGRHFGIFDDKLRINATHMNPFENVNNAQLAQLKKAWIKTMNDKKLLEGEFKVVATNGKEA